MPEKAIVDTSALIALDKIDLLPLLCKIYSDVLLTEAVVMEFGTSPVECCSVEKVGGSLIRLLMENLNLGRGEAEVISLGHERGVRVVIDDAKARNVADLLGLRVTGTIGVLVKAESAGLIESAYKKAQELKEKGFYLSDDVLSQISKQSAG